MVKLQLRLHNKHIVGILALIDEKSPPEIYFSRQSWSNFGWGCTEKGMTEVLANSKILQKKSNLAQLGHKVLQIQSFVLVFRKKEITVFWMPTPAALIPPQAKVEFLDPFFGFS